MIVPSPPRSVLSSKCQFHTQQMCGGGTRCTPTTRHLLSFQPRILMAGLSVAGYHSLYVLKSGLGPGGWNHGRNAGDTRQFCPESSSSAEAGQPSQQANGSSDPLGIPPANTSRAVLAGAGGRGRGPCGAPSPLVSPSSQTLFNHSPSNALASIQLHVSQAGGGGAGGAAPALDPG